MLKKQTGPRGGLLGRIWKKRALYCMLAIPLALLVIFKYLPIYGVQIAFRDYLPGRSIAESPWVGWKYFVKFFSGVKFSGRCCAIRWPSACTAWRCFPAR